MRYYIAKWDEEGTIYLCNQFAFIIRSRSEEKIVKEIDKKLAMFICHLEEIALPDKNRYAIPL